MKRGHRKLPFSGKKKKKQLQDKRARLANKQEDDSNEGDFETEVNDSLQQKNTNEKNLKKKIEASSSQSINDTVSIKAQDITRLNSVFEKQTPQEIRKLQNESMIPFTRLPLTALEVSKEESYTTIIDFPKRPPWNYDMTKEELESKEKHYFQEWLSNIYEQYPKEELSFFEHNLNVWRQLWRVLEISDIFLVLVDIRHPLLHFPPSLYDYIVNQLKRKMFLVFNKIDLVTKNTVYAWKNYFKKEFPEIVVVEFSCYPCDKKFVDDTSTAYLQKRTKRPRKRYYQPVGIKDFLTKCSNLKLNKLGVEVDWASLIQEYSSREQSLNNIQQDDDDGDDGDTDDDDDDERAIVKEEETYVNEEGNDKSQNELNNSDVNQIETQLKLLGVQCEMTPRNNLITIGLIGHPNVGKSSFINSFMGKTVVSTSRTPGHTKHFQTIHLSANVRLCDSPGLVFPSLLSKQIQILCGLYPIAQVQEPYSSIKYLAERIRLENILKIQPPETKNEYKWSAWDICEAFAIKRGFYSGKSARPDSYRAANAILRLVIDGRILLSFKPPGFYNLQK